MKYPTIYSGTSKYSFSTPNSTTEWEYAGLKAFNEILQ